MCVAVCVCARARAHLSACVRACVRDACDKQVGGKDVAGIEKIEDVHKLLTGPVGSKVRLKLSRSGLPAKRAPSRL